jgi:hypothetical protein
MGNKYLKIGAVGLGLFLSTLCASVDADSFFNEDGSVRYQGVTYQPEDLELACRSYNVRMGKGFNILSGTAIADVPTCFKIKVTGLGIPV